MKRFLDRKIFEHIDWPLLICALSIVLLGLLNLYSATLNLPVAKHFRSQSGWVGIGLVLSVLVTLFDYRLLRRFTYPIYGLMIGMLVLVLVMGKTALGAQRWLILGPLSIQPSELAKLALIFGLARYFHHRRAIQSMGFAELFWPSVIILIPCVLILRQPDLGTAVIVFSIGASMILFEGVRGKVILMLVGVSLVAAPLSWQFVLRPYQKARVHTFLNPEKDALGQGYQIIQSKIAIGSGQLAGKGYLKGTQTKLQFLPKQYTDFVFSNFAEEFGFLGSSLLLFLYSVFSLLGLNVAVHARDKFGMMLALGLTAFVFFQAVVNLGMETGLLPVVGVTLPLFSYGGTSMMATLLSVGLLLNIGMRRYLF